MAILSQLTPTFFANTLLGFTASRGDGFTYRILIVDDHPVVRAGLASMLGTQAEFKVIGSASSGAEALALLREKTADVALVDIGMPEMTGRFQCGES